MGHAEPLIVAGLGMLFATALATAGVPRQEERPGERPIHQRIDVPSIAACGGCHQQVYEEWAETLHARSWTNANIREATNNFAKKSCRPCHSPQPVLISGLDRAPDFRDFNHEDGIHCLSCHGLAEGVAAARTIESAPCKPIFSPDLVRTESCFPCHEPTHQAFEEFYTSDAYEMGLRCVDCHMPPRTDSPGRFHGATGGFDPDFVKRALEWTAKIEAGSLVLTLRNRAAHKFPGEIPARSFLIRVEIPGAEPQTLLLRKPNKEEDRVDDRLLPDEIRTLSFPLPADARTATVRLYFRPLPLLTDEDSILLGEWSGTVGG